MAATKPKKKTLSRGTKIRDHGLAGKVALVEKATMTNPLSEFKAGDTVKVHARIKEGEKERIQIFEGLVIARGNKGGSRSFTVRKMSHGVGVERIFLDNSPKVAKVERVQEGKVRRAKLYYIRGLEGKAAKIERELDQTQKNAKK